MSSTELFGLLTSANAARELDYIATVHRELLGPEEGEREATLRALGDAAEQLRENDGAVSLGVALLGE